MEKIRGISKNFQATAGPHRSRLAVNASWLLRLRWVAVIGQLITIGVAVGVFQVRIATTPLLALVAFTAVTNWLLTLGLRSSTGRHALEADSAGGYRLLGGVMTIDLLSLTGLLYFAGGPSNPFFIFYLVNLALSAVILPARAARWLTLVAIACFTALFVFHVPLAALETGGARPAPATRLDLARFSLLTAFAACALVIVQFITRVTDELRRREAELRVVEQENARSQRLEALATLAAGAGHELATPLSTIAVVTKELTRHLEGAEVPKTVIEDVALIRGELDHCRAILDRMAGKAGQAVGEQIEPVVVEELVEEVLDELRGRERVEFAVDGESGRCCVLAPFQGLAQAVRGVVQNALDATDPEGRVTLSIGCDRDDLVLAVVDNGPGMAPDVLARVGEPFFTTKEPGRGMGMGVFFVRHVVERLGGSWRLDSAPGRGCTAVIRLPLVVGDVAQAAAMPDWTSSPTP